MGSGSSSLTTEQKAHIAKLMKEKYEKLTTTTPNLTEEEKQKDMEKYYNELLLSLKPPASLDSLRKEQTKKKQPTRRRSYGDDKLKSKRDLPPRPQGKNSNNTNGSGTSPSNTNSSNVVIESSGHQQNQDNSNHHHHSNSNNNNTTSTISSSLSKKSTKPKNQNNDLEQEVVNLAWQAQAEAITQAASRGEHLNMQNFLRTPKISSPKSWVVMKDGNLTIYPNTSLETEGAVEKNQPTAIFSLKGCICRPIEHQSGFEVGFMILKQGKTSIEWVQFWTETDIQCRAWIMALQHSANLISHQK
mmetsp:Transcript_4897/g.4985  ORF Transcript_4897/g.4985 Transcript_4897/m.4985 type:complete len:302 (+) Transcript_4897:44-949(+)